ncbi:hypothetical protein GWK47_053883 [Chionoecetes opilio]|uniref:Uncharacterized protein n=1 Tax=Chionoecetes opilio TaxID=41210 RepID=A0A8J4Y7J2_CHIOP|nr:hypothetical protein GWK47_053883 [Chionoecetes opilio]
MDSGIQHKLLWIVGPKRLAVAATIRRAWRLLGPPVLSRAPTRSGDRTDFVPRVLNAFGGEATPALERRIDVVGSVADLDDSDDDGLQLHHLFSFGICDGQMCERGAFHVGKRFFQILVQTSHRTPLPYSPAGQEEFFFRNGASE